MNIKERLKLVPPCIIGYDPERGMQIDPRYVVVAGRKVMIDGVGKLRVPAPLPAPAGATLAECWIMQEPDGEWSCELAYEYDDGL